MQRVNLISKVACQVIFVSVIISCYGLSFADCVYNETKYADLSEICKSGHKYQCAYKTWIEMNVECQDAQPVRTFENFNCSCTDDDLNNCLSSGLKCRATQELGGCVMKCVE